jgi:hypothetical protein
VDPVWTPPPKSQIKIIILIPLPPKKKKKRKIMELSGHAMGTELRNKDKAGQMVPIKSLGTGKGKTIVVNDYNKN